MQIRSACVLIAVASVLAIPVFVSGREQSSAAHHDIAALNAAMVAAFKRGPAEVGTFYGDAAAIMGGALRIQGRAGIDGYWQGMTSFVDWSLEVIETGGPADAPWEYGRSVLTTRSGQKMETFFIGLLRRMQGGSLKFQIDAYTRHRGDDPGEAAGRTFAAYLAAVEKGDPAALGTLLDDNFTIVSGSGDARNKAAEIADLVPQSGGKVEYFRSDDTRTRGFGELALTTGILNWKFNGREFQRNHATIAIKRGTDWKILAQQVTPRQ